MKFNEIFVVLVALIVSLPGTALGGGGHDHGHEHGHGHAQEEHEEKPRGPHGGVLFSKDDFALEVAIFEEGVPPQFRVYPFTDEKPERPGNVQAAITLSRFARSDEEFTLVPEADYLTSEQVVSEPHSFTLHVRAEFGGKKFNWKHESHEGRTELSEGALKVANIEISNAGPHEILTTARVYGRLLPNENKVAHVLPRFPGVIVQIEKTLGDQVEKGEVLATIESNQSLKSYEIRSQIAGVVIKRHATLGEFVPDSREIFVIADLSEIWADFQVYRDDFGSIEAGQSISVDLGNEAVIPAKVRYVAPVIDEATQSKLVRAVLPNPAGELKPGLFVSGILSSAGTTVPIAVKRDAIQTFRDWSVVYLTDGHVFQAMPVTLGRKDLRYIEITSGLVAGDRYVSKNSFIIKADVEKSGASHDH